MGYMYMCMLATLVLLKLRKRMMPDTQSNLRPCCLHTKNQALGFLNFFQAQLS